MSCTLAHLHTPLMRCVHMGGLTMIPLSHLRKRGKNVLIEPNHVSLIIVYEYKVVK